MGEDIEWGAGPVFDEVLENMDFPEGDETPVELFTIPDTPPSEKIVSGDEKIPLDPEELSSILGPGGQFAKKFVGYEH